MSTEQRPIDLRAQRWRLSPAGRLLRKPIVWRRHLGLKSEDFFIGSYPRSGRTWLAFILAEILTGRPSTFGGLNHPIPSIENHHRAPKLTRNGGRILRTHEKHRKTYHQGIYLVRHPADVIASYLRYHVMLGIAPPFDEFLENFLHGAVDGYGRWDVHVRSWLDAGDGIHVIRYEDLRADTSRSVKDVLSHMGFECPIEVVELAIRNNDLQAMRLKERTRTDKPRARERKNASFVGTGSAVGGSQKLPGDSIQRINEAFHEVMASLAYCPDS